MLHLEVNSPRILFFKSLGAIGDLIKIAILAGLLVLAGWGIKKGVNHTFVHNPEFALQDIKLTTNGFITKQRIVEETGIQEGDTLFSLSINEIQEKLESLPETVEVTVDRELPGYLVIHIVERVPVAWIEALHLGFQGREAKAGMLVDAEGVVFPCEGKLWDVARNLPVIRIESGEADDFTFGQKTLHEDILRALHLVTQFERQFPEAGWGLEVVKVNNFYTLMVDCTDGVLIYFGMYDHERQLQDVGYIRDHAAETERELSWLDVRPNYNIPGGYKNGQAIRVTPNRAVPVPQGE